MYNRFWFSKIFLSRFSKIAEWKKTVKIENFKNKTFQNINNEADVIFLFLVFGTNTRNRKITSVRVIWYLGLRDVFIRHVKRFWVFGLYFVDVLMCPTLWISICTFAYFCVFSDYLCNIVSVVTATEVIVCTTLGCSFKTRRLAVVFNDVTNVTDLIVIFNIVVFTTFPLSTKTAYWEYPTQ